MARCSTCGGSAEDRAIVATYHDQIAWWRGQDRELAVADPAIDAAGRCVACGLTDRDREVVDNVYDQTIYAETLDLIRATKNPEEGYPLPGVQARGTRYADGCLVLRGADPDHDVYVLVVARSLSEYLVVGWTYGRDAKRCGGTSGVGPGGAPLWFVPQAALHSMETLMAFPRTADARRN